MNPLFWSGEWFLLFYAGLVVLVVAALVAVRGSRGQSQSSVEILDPYGIAVLRGGAGEALRVAAASLVERGALQVEGDVLRLADSPRELHTVEAALLRACAGGRKLDALDDPALLDACEPLRQKLVALGLLPSDETQRELSRLRAGSIVLLLGVAAAKVATALARGHTNLFFLMLLACAAASGVVAYLGASGPTASGEAVLRAWEARLSRPSSDGRVLDSPSGSDPFTMLAAVFGLAGLPLALYPWLAAFAAKKERPHTASGCGSGGGCGGGEGGGCGGCGGCGG